MTSVFPKKAALIKGVTPAVLAASTSAPRTSSSCKMSQSKTELSAVHKFYLLKVLLDRLKVARSNSIHTHDFLHNDFCTPKRQSGFQQKSGKHTSTTGAWPRRAASSRGVSRSRFRGFGSRQTPRSSSTTGTLPQVAACPQKEPATHFKGGTSPVQIFPYIVCCRLVYGKHSLISTKEMEF